MFRRDFLGALAAAFPFDFARVGPRLAIRYRKPRPEAPYLPLVDPDHDVFACERESSVIEAHLAGLLERKSLPLAPGFAGVSPEVLRYTPVADAVSEAEFGRTSSSFENGLRSWIESLGEVRRASFWWTGPREEVGSRPIRHRQGGGWL